MADSPTCFTHSHRLYLKLCPFTLAITAAYVTKGAGLLQGKINPYSGSCDIVTIAGHTTAMSKGMIAGIVIGSIIAIIVVFGIIAGTVWCCCCQLKR